MSEFGFVYMFFRHKNDEKPVYVGFTTNPVQRLSGHFKDNSKGNGKLDRKAYKQITHIKVAYVGTERDAINMETQLIHAYSPEFNTEGIVPQSQAKWARVPDWSQWPSFSKTEIIRDKTVVFRCFGANTFSEIGDEATKETPTDSEKPERSVNYSQVRLMQVKMGEMQHEIDFWKHLCDEKDKEAIHWYNELRKELELNKLSTNNFRKILTRARQDIDWSLLA